MEYFEGESEMGKYYISLPYRQIYYPLFYTFYFQLLWHLYPQFHVGVVKMTEEYFVSNLKKAHSLLKYSLDTIALPNTFPLRL